MLPISFFGKIFLDWFKQIFSGFDLFLQTLQAELGARVALLLQQHVSLSMENSKLKQQIARVQQEKLITEGEFVFILLWGPVVDLLCLIPLVKQNQSTITSRKLPNNYGVSIY